MISIGKKKLHSLHHNRFLFANSWFDLAIACKLFYTNKKESNFLNLLFMKILDIQMQASL